MANEATKADTAVKTAPAKTEYTMAEFVAAAKATFGETATPQMVMAAFRFNHVEKATVEDAKKLYTAFANRKVES